MYEKIQSQDDIPLWCDTIDCDGDKSSDAKGK